MRRNRSVLQGTIVFTVIAFDLLATHWLPKQLPLMGRPSRWTFSHSAGSTAEETVPRLPMLRIRTSNKHLIEDENGTPFFVAGVCPQNLIHTSTPEQMDTYFADRQKRHFNFAWVAINAFSGCTIRSKPATNPVDGRGNSMLLGGESWNPQNLNPAYVASVDAMVRSAANHGIYLFLDPFSVAYNPSPNGFDPSAFDPSKHSSDEMRQWGEFWGSRYKNYTHVNFVLGNDRLVAPQVDSVVSGLQKYMPHRLMTTDWIGGPPDWSSDATGPRRFYDAGHHWVNFNGWYQYHAPQWAAWTHYNMVDPVMPTCIFETFYEACGYGNPKPNPTIPQMMREQVWAAVLNGGSGFGILGSPDCIDDPMKWLGKTPGLEQAEYCTTFFTRRRWYDLVPDWSHTFLTSQSGKPGEEDYTYVSAALTGDGSLGLCYYPGRSGRKFQLTVNMSRMGGGTGSSRAYWYDPTNGSHKTVERLTNSGSHNFVTPDLNSKGAADWVLVLERD
ncbi:MAG TPA: DUF4038 domain-containing protein [Terriglobia bacterium]|nr:DUF4038 domain-containing protein [Terriglobia bacterium]